MSTCLPNCLPSAPRGCARWAVLLALFVLPTLSACGREVMVEDDESLTPVFSATAEIDRPEKPVNVERAYAVQLDRAQLILIQGAGRVPDFIRMPDGRRLDYEVQAVEGDPPRVWRGRLYEGGQSRGSLTLSRSGGRLTGSFRLGDERFALQADGSGEVVLLKFDDTEPPPHGRPVIPDEGDG